MVGDGRDSQNPLCSIVIRAYNEEKHIGRLLAGIIEQTVFDMEIILVDSGSTDATRAIASRYPVQILTIEPGDFTFGRSLNLGCAQARGEFIVVASAHVYPVYPDWLELLLAPFADPEIALTYGKQRGDGRTRYSEHRHFAKLFPDETTSRQSSPFCNNANAAIRRRLWEEHPYDETLSGLEDLAWARWATAQGYFLAYVSEAEVIHVHDETPRQVYNRYRREAMALKRIEPEERFNLVDFLRLYTFNLFRDLQTARQRGDQRSVWWEIVWFRFMQFWGTYRGFAHSGTLTGDLKKTFYYPGEPHGYTRAESRTVAPIDYGVAHPAEPRDEEIGELERGA